jgi:protein-S-isoprenylcysteine O-methyltransferase Ste14
MSSREAETPGVPVPPPAIFSGAFVAGLALDIILPLRLASRFERFLVGGALAALGLVIGGTAARDMRASGTALDPRKPATALVTSGPFRRTRNPLYLSMALCYAGTALLLNRITALFLLPFAVRAVERSAVEREERYLECRFGDAYREYRTRVPRWF